MKSLLATCLSLGLALCPALAVAQVTAAVTVTVAPPALLPEPPSPVPGPGFVWCAGYWGWNNVQHVWIPGRWARPPRANDTWIPAEWHRHGPVWDLIPGRWQSLGTPPGSYVPVTAGQGPYYRPTPQPTFVPLRQPAYGQPAYGQPAYGQPVPVAMPVVGQPVQPSFPLPGQAPQTGLPIPGQPSQPGLPFVPQGPQTGLPIPGAPSQGVPFVGQPGMPSPIQPLAQPGARPMIPVQVGPVRRRWQQP